VPLPFPIALFVLGQREDHVAGIGQCFQYAAVGEADRMAQS
jgi:hypothetical protein